MSEDAGPAEAGPADSGAPSPGAPSPQDPSTDHLTEVVVESEVLRRGHYLTFRIDTVERADGTRAKREIVGHPGAVAILAIDPDDNILLVRQFRSATGRALLEVPAGTLDVDPATGVVEDHALAAKRELEEETGYRAGSWRLLTSFWTAPGFATELMHLYLATDLTPAHEDRLGPDEDERLELVRRPFADAVAAAERGDIADAKSLVALLWLDRIALAEPVPSAGAGATNEVPSAEAGVSVQYVGTATELARASMALTRRSRFGQVVGLLFIAAGVYLAVTSELLAGILPFVFGLLLVTGLLAAPFAYLVWWRRRDLMRQPTSFVASASGVDFASAFGRSHLAWEAMTRIRETPGYLYLETGINNLYVPKRAFGPDQLAEFRRIVAEAGFGPDGRRPPRRSTTPAGPPP
jgi:ADP-ribose pyrophosphatase